MFFEGDRIDAVREMILAESDDRPPQGVWPSCCRISRSDFEGIFRALNGLPACIRLLDPPLHEFLPARAQASRTPWPSKLGISADEVAKRVHELHEFNPMLGFRGCRLGIKYPRDHRDAGPGHLPGGCGRAEGRDQGASRRS